MLAYWKPNIPFSLEIGNLISLKNETLNVSRSIPAVAASVSPALTASSVVRLLGPNNPLLSWPEFRPLDVNEVTSEF